MPQTISDLVRLDVLQRLCDPFVGVCWAGLAMPISRSGVQAAIDAGHFYPPNGEDCQTPSQHVGRIAWFAVHGWTQPIDIDVGIPTMGCVVDWPVVDGNHRLAAALFRGDTHIAADWSRSHSHAEFLGLLSP